MAGTPIYRQEKTMENNNTGGKPQQASNKPNNFKPNQGQQGNPNKKKHRHHHSERAKTYQGQLYDKLTDKVPERMGGKPQPAPTPIPKEISEMNAAMDKLNALIEPNLSIRRRVEASRVCPGKFEVREHDFKRVDQSSKFDATILSCKDREEIEGWISRQLAFASDFFSKKDWSGKKPQ